MAALRNRVCARCDAAQMTRSRSEVCFDCSKEIAKEESIEEEREALEGLYTNVEDPIVDKYGHRVWSFVHDCGTQQSWVYGNILKRLKLDPDNVPCSHCGGKRRSKNATIVSAENRKIKNPVGWIEYMQVVRRLTANTYAAHRSEINPNNYVRGHNAYHLDHIMPISEGYEKALPPEFLARKENLQMLTAKDNLSKGRKLCLSF